MFDFLKDTSKISLSKIGLTVIVFTFGGLILFTFLKSINYYQKDFQKKRLQYPIVIRFINGYVFGLIVALIIAYGLSYFGHPINRLNRFIAITIVVGILLKMNYWRIKLGLDE
jgi:uncharacterized protein YacL